MSLAAKLLSASGGGVDKPYVDDVFSAFTYTANQSARTIVNGIDLAGKGGMVWFKNRSDAYSHVIHDSNRGITKALIPNAANSELTRADSVTSFNSNGFNLGTDAGGNGTNYLSGNSVVSWTFRKSAKFFDIVTYTGNGVAGRQIPHSLGVAPGMVIAKATSVTGDYYVYHQNVGSSPANSAGYSLLLNATNDRGSLNNLIWGGVAPTSSVFNLGSPPYAPNVSGVTYVAYLFAHDTSADGIVQCGSYVGNSGTLGPVVNLGFEPQFLLVKNATNAADWFMFDTARGISTGGVDPSILANTSAAENPNNDLVQVLATGFQPINSTINTSPQTYIYLAIRRPNKPPTLGTQVYNAIARTGTGAAATVTGVGFAPDLAICHERGNLLGSEPSIQDRLRGATAEMKTASTAAEAAVSGITSFNMDGFSLGTGNPWNWTTETFINWCFKRAPGVFDVVCYTGTGGGGDLPVAHALGAIPELVIVKNRASAGQPWCVHGNSFPASRYLQLNSTSAFIDNTIFGTAADTLTTFNTTGTTSVNAASHTYVAYLFATKAGISKVGSYTGNGTSQTIDCGFTTGARFVMIKRTDSTGDWYVWDTVRGLVAGNDPHLSLNSTAAEITTDDSLDPASVGFIVNQLAATNINVTSASYIYLSFA